MRFLVLLAAGLLLLTLAPAQPIQLPLFKAIGPESHHVCNFDVYNNVLYYSGGLINNIVAPGPGGKEYFYAAYTYWPTNFDIVAIDPTTFNVTVIITVHNQLAGEIIYWKSDGHIYFGDHGNGGLGRLDPATWVYEDFGVLQPGQSIWGLWPGSDNLLYVGTAPKAIVLRFDPATKTVDSLGSVMPAPATYVHSVAGAVRVN